MLVQPIGDYMLKEVTFYSLLFPVPSVFMLAINTKVPEKTSRPSSPPWSARFIGRMLVKAPRKLVLVGSLAPTAALGTLDPPTPPTAAWLPGADLPEFLPSSLAEARMCTAPYCSTEEVRAQGCCCREGGTGLWGPPSPCHPALQPEVLVPVSRGSPRRGPHGEDLGLPLNSQLDPVRGPPSRWTLQPQPGRQTTAGAASIFLQPHEKPQARTAPPSCSRAPEPQKQGGVRVIPAAPHHDVGRRRRTHTKPLCIRLHTHYLI